VLNSQVPKYSWSEPRRPTAVGTEHKLGGGTRLTYLRPPFAARMTSYIEEERVKCLGQKADSVEAEKLDGNKSSFKINLRGSFGGKGSSQKLPEISTKLVMQSREIDLPKEPELVNDQELPRISSTQTVRRVSASGKQVQFINPLSTSSSEFKHSQTRRDVHSQSPSRIARSFWDARERKPKTLQTSSSARAPGLEGTLTSQLGNSEEQVLGRVAPRPSTLLSKHPKNVRYVRDTCFFHPAQERKKHYYIVNPNWFSEQRVTVPKNNVFS